MVADKSHQGWIFPGDGRDAEAQLRAAGAQHITTIGGKRTWRDAVRLVRRGDVIRIIVLVRLPTRRGHDELPPVAQVREIIREIEDRGGLLIEVYTGRRSDKKSDKSGMIADAIRSLKTQGRRLMPPGHRKPGRPKTATSEADTEAARRAWHSRDYATNAVAVRHMPSGWTESLARRRFGVSGRPWPKRARKT